MQLTLVGLTEYLGADCWPVLGWGGSVSAVAQDALFLALLLLFSLLGTLGRLRGCLLLLLLLPELALAVGLVQLEISLGERDCRRVASEHSDEKKKVRS